MYACMCMYLCMYFLISACPFFVYRIWSGASEFSFCILGGHV